jgi:hypothetical protein
MGLKNVIVFKYKTLKHKKSELTGILYTSPSFSVNNSYICLFILFIFN